MWHHSGQFGNVTHTHSHAPSFLLLNVDIVSHKKMQVLLCPLKTFAQREDFRLRSVCVWFVNRTRMQRGCEVTLFCMFFPFCQIRTKRRETKTLKWIGSDWFGLVYFGMV